MEAIIRFLQDTGFYLFTQDGNWRCLVMIGIACVLLYLGIVKKFEPLLLVPTYCFRYAHHQSSRRQYVP